MKKLFALLPFVLAASVASAQDANPPRDAQQQPGMKSAERQYAGEVVSADATAKTLTFKTIVPDAAGERSEKTVTMAVSDSAAPNLAALKAGDKVTVALRRDDTQQKDWIVKISKGGAPKE